MKPDFQPPYDARAVPGSISVNPSAILAKTKQTSKPHAYRAQRTRLKACHDRISHCRGDRSLAERNAAEKAAWAAVS